MKGFLTKLGIASVLATFVLASVSFWAQAAEKKRLTWTNKRGPSISETIVYPGDDPRHTLGQSVRIDTTTSPDPDYHEAQTLVYGQSDSVAGSGSHRGYLKRIHKNGDETYTKYEGTHKRTSKEGGAWEEISEGTWQVIGGTGKFKNIKGSGTYKGQRTAEGGTTEVEGEVEY